MSNRIVALLAIGLAMVPHRSIGAQFASREADSLLRSVRALDSALLVRSRSVDSIRRALVRPVPPVDIRQGPIHVRTESTLAPRVRGAVDSVARLIERRGGAFVAARASAHVATIRRDSTRSIVGTLPVIAIDADTATRWSLIGQRQVRAPASAAAIANGLASIVEQRAMQGVDSALAAWVMVGRAPLRLASAAEAADAYVEYATTESAVLRRCRERDAFACLDALGVDSMSGSRLDRWYAAEDYRALLRVVAPARDDSAAVAAWIRCRRDGDNASCEVAARALPNARVPLPLSASVRFAFLREVLDAGGDGAFDRLVGSSGSVRNRLTAAAREPLDRTALRWLDRLEGSRPERMRIPATLVAASLGWSGLILGLALIRRTSWA
jgi:hypothetical protein